MVRPPCFAILSPTNIIVFFIFKLSVSNVVSKRNFVVSILSSFATNLSHSVLLTISFFTTLLSLAKPLGTGVNLLISSLSTSVFKLAKLDFSAELLASECDIFLSQFFCIIR